MSKLDLDRDGADSIPRHFAELEDPRCEINRRHVFGDMIVICILAVLAGADGPTAIHAWAKSNADWLKRRLELPHGVPSRDTIRRLLSLLQPSAFQKCFQSWVAQSRSANAPDGPEIIAIDEGVAPVARPRKRTWAVVPGQRAGRRGRNQPGPIGNGGKIERNHRD